MAYITGKQAFLQILKQEGVSVMFGNPGTTELPLMDGLAREPGIHYVLALQEAVAIAMADAYAQARILKQRTKALKGFSAEDDRYVAMDLDKPLIDFVGLARSLGVPGTRVEKTSDIGPAVGKALASGGPHLVDVRIDPAFA